MNTTPKPPTRCGHWIGAASRYCHTTIGVRPYLIGPRCPAHTPARIAGRPDSPSIPIHPQVTGPAPVGDPTTHRRDDDTGKDTMELRSHHQALLRNAVDYAAWGWPVFLLGRSKRPIANCPACPKGATGHDPQTCECLTCHGFYAATLNVERFEAMLAAHPSGLLAIRTGQASGLLVIDIDPAHGGRLDPTLMTPTYAVATGGGGWHLYYTHPGIPVLSRPMPDRDGVDVKADGGYVVAPPSVHPITRQPYRPVGDRPVNEMPRRLLDVCQTVTAPTPALLPAVPPVIGPSSAVGGRGISNPAALLAANLDAVTRAPEGRRRVTLHGAARGVARIVVTGAISAEQARAELTAVGRRAEQTDRDIDAAITGAFRAEGVPV